MSLLFILLGLVSLEVAAVKIVPGRAFDRLITIWLENQVRVTTHKHNSTSATATATAAQCSNRTFLGLCKMYC